MFNFVYNWDSQSYIDQDLRGVDNKRLIEEKINNIETLEELFGVIRENLADVGKNGLNGITHSLFSIFTMQDDRRPDTYRPQNQDFDRNYDLIFTGCSQTHGDHITPPLVEYGDHNNIWGFKVADYFNKSSLNMGMGAYSIYAIVRSLFNQIFKNGNPQMILALFPDFGRFTLPHSKIIKPEQKSNEDYLVQAYLNHSFIKMYKRDNFISKVPHVAENVLDITLPLFYNLQSILFLEKYCEVNNIYLKYSSWHTSTNKLLSLLKNDTDQYKSFIDVDSVHFWSDGFNSYNETMFTECHKDLEDKYPKIFKYGIDKHHIGVHRHAHIAEGFIKEIENDNFWNK